MSSNRSGLGLFLIVIVLMVAMFGAVFLIFNPFKTQITTTSTTATSCQQGCALNLPIQFMLVNSYAQNQKIQTTGNALKVLKLSTNPATVYEYGDANAQGVWVTTKTYTSGDSYRLQIFDANSKYEFGFQVPVAANSTQKNFPITVNMVLIGSYTVQVSSPDGSPLAGTWNVTAKGNPHPQFTIALAGNSPNSGFQGNFQRYDVLENGYPRTLVANALIITDLASSGVPKSSVTSSNFARITSTSTTYYYEFTLPEHAVDSHRLSDGTIDPLVKGQYATTMTFDCTKLPQGATETVTLIFVAYLSVYYYSTNQAFNSEAVQLASVSFTLGA